MKQKKKKKKEDNKNIFLIKTVFEKEEDYYKSKIVRSFSNDNYIEYETNGDKNSNLSLDEYLNNIKPYMKPYI